MAALLALMLSAGAAPRALADGDPGSDVLVYQSLFAESDAGLSVAQQAQLGALLKASARAGVPIRVAIIAARTDLGAVTALWRQPRAYARFLGIELSLAYRQRLLVVMPDGFGFHWDHHSSAGGYRALSGIAIGPGGAGVLAAAETAVTRLAHTAGVALRAPTAASSASAASSTVPATTASVPASASSGPPAASSPAPKHGLDQTLGVIGLAALALLAVALVLRRRVSVPRMSRRAAIPAAGLLLAALIATALVIARPSSPPTSSAAALAANPVLDPGTPVSGPAPDFTLTDQFGRPASLHAYRGRVVVLAFNDSECTTECPLTTKAMLDAKAMLGASGRRVQLLGIDANPAATSLQDVWSYSQLHGMLHAWRFLTGSLSALTQVWKQYKVEAAIERDRSPTPRRCS